MAESTILQRARQTLSGWIWPAPVQRQQLIKYSESLPQMLGVPIDSASRPGAPLASLIGHYGNEIWVYVAVSKVAQSAAGVPLRVKKGGGDEDESDVIPSGPLPELLENPNPQQSH